MPYLVFGLALVLLIVVLVAIGKAIHDTLPTQEQRSRFARIMKSSLAILVIAVAGWTLPLLLAVVIAIVGVLYIVYLFPNNVFSKSLRSMVYPLLVKWRGFAVGVEQDEERKRIEREKSIEEARKRLQSELAERQDVLDVLLKRYWRFRSPTAMSSGEERVLKDEGIPKDYGRVEHYENVSKIHDERDIKGAELEVARLQQELKRVLEGTESKPSEESTEAKTFQDHVQRKLSIHKKAAEMKKQIEQDFRNDPQMREKALKEIERVEKSALEQYEDLSGEDNRLF